MNRQSWTRRRASSSSDAGSDLDGSDPDRSDPGRTDADGPEKALSRRKIFKRAVIVDCRRSRGRNRAGGRLRLPGIGRAGHDRRTGRGGAHRRLPHRRSDDRRQCRPRQRFPRDPRRNRTMGSPSNPVDGQQIVFQVTQGTGGPFTITWTAATSSPLACPSPPSAPRRGRPTCSASSTTRPWAHGCCRVREGVQLDDREPEPDPHHNPDTNPDTDPHHDPDRRLPAVPVHERPVVPGVILGEHHRRCPVRGHPGRHVVRRLLLLGPGTNGDTAARKFALWNVTGAAPGR